VRQAAADFMLLANEQQHDPEKFGKTIMQTELTCLQWREAMEKAQLSGQGAEFQRAQAAYQEWQQKLQILLAVLAISSPE